MCEFATNSSVEERKERHNRWYDLKKDKDFYFYYKLWSFNGKNLAKSDVVVFEIVLFMQ